jgi:hypothetical protein
VEYNLAGSSYLRFYLAPKVRPPHPLPACQSIRNTF